MHPLLTDVVIGSWTSATLLDVLGGRESEPAAEKLIAVGIDMWRREIARLVSRFLPKTIERQETA